MTKKRKKFKPARVVAKYGSPMGRLDIMPDDTNAPVTLDIEELTMVDSDYDTGGAYWGGWSQTHGCMRVAFGKGIAIFERARDVREAAEKVRALLPNATFTFEAGKHTTLARNKGTEQ